jgi:predicted nucleic acid-binding protein
MKCFLDINSGVHFLRDQFNVKRKLKLVDYRECVLSKITEDELHYDAGYGNQVAFQKDLVDKFLIHVTNIPITNALLLFSSEQERLIKKGPKIFDFDVLTGCSTA